MSGKWSREVWRLAEPIYNEILNLPFVRELAAGTLSEERFLFYLEQDALYIDNYCRVLAHIASRIGVREYTEDFLRFASDGVAVEKALHESFLKDGVKDVVPTPTCLLYCSYESACGLQPVEIEVAAVLPCFWVYQRVGKEILGSCRPGNPYARWIETYADEMFEASTSRAIEICDALAAFASKEIRERMTEAFLNSTRMEWMFWESAYNLEKWKI